MQPDGQHAAGDEGRDWANGLPDALLMQIFDLILTAPTAHPKYLPEKAKHVYRLGSVCKSWHNAIMETSIGVCVPAKLPDEVIRWISRMTLRAVEFHDPEHTEPKVVQLLSNPSLLAKSSKSMISLIDAPVHKKGWLPSSFPNLLEMVLWRPSSSRSSPNFDVRTIKDLAHLQYLVLACGFTGIRNVHMWPPQCKRLVWTCPSDAHSSKLSIPSVPAGISLQWISLRAYAVRIQDFSSLLGRISELVIHAMYIFVTVPPQCYPSLNDISCTPFTTRAVSKQGRARAWKKWKREHDWAGEGLRSLAQLMVSDVGLLLLRLRFSRVLISQPLTGRFKDISWRMLGLHRERQSDEGPSSADKGDDDGDIPPPSSDEDTPGRGSHHCASCGQPYRVPDYSSSSSEEDGEGGDGEGDQSGEGGAVDGHDGEHKKKKKKKGRRSGSSGSASDESDFDDLMYDELSPEQVTAAFRASIDSYSSMLAAKTAQPRPLQRPALPMPNSSSVGGWRGGLGRSSHSQDSSKSALGAPPIDYSKVVPLLDGRHNPGSDREIVMTRKHQDPTEPARLRFDQPGGVRGSMPLRSALPGLLSVSNQRPVQAVCFAPWPYPPDAADALVGDYTAPTPAPAPSAPDQPSSTGTAPDQPSTTGTDQPDQPHRPSDYMHAPSATEATPPAASSQAADEAADDGRAHPQEVHHTTHQVTCEGAPPAASPQPADAGGTHPQEVHHTTHQITCEGASRVRSHPVVFGRDSECGSSECSDTEAGGRQPGPSFAHQQEGKGTVARGSDAGAVGWQPGPSFAHQQVENAEGRQSGPSQLVHQQEAKPSSHEPSQGQQYSAVKAASGCDGAGVSHVAMHGGSQMGLQAGGGAGGGERSTDGVSHVAVHGGLQMGSQADGGAGGGERSRDGERVSVGVEGASSSAAAEPAPAAAPSAATTGAAQAGNSSQEIAAGAAAPAPAPAPDAEVAPAGTSSQKTAAVPAALAAASTEAAQAGTSSQEAAAVAPTDGSLQAPAPAAASSGKQAGGDQNRRDAENAQSSKSGAGEKHGGESCSWIDRYGQLQLELLTHPHFLANAVNHMHKINSLQLPRGWSEASLRALFAPFMMLTKVSLITMDDPSSPDFPSAFLPITVVKTSFFAGNPNQRFDSKLVSNLTELWRISLHGYKSLDLSNMPEVRPGLLLKIVETPPRQAPLGKEGVDVLMPKGRVIDMSLQIGTDTTVSSMENMGADFVTKVDLSAWAPLCKDLNLRSPSGVELHHSAGRSPGSLFQALYDTPLEQFTVCIATDHNGDIMSVPPSAQTVARRRQEGQRCPPVFAFVSSSGARMHGVHMSMLVKHRMGHKWDLEVMDASAVDDEEGLLFFTFFKSDNPAPPPPPGVALGGGIPPMGFAPVPNEQMGAAMAAAQQQLEALMVAAGAGGPGAEELAAAAAAAMTDPHVMEHMFHHLGVPPEGEEGEEEEEEGNLLDDLD